MKMRVLQVALGVVLGLMVALTVAFRDLLPLQGGHGLEDEASLLLPEPFPAPPLRLVDPQGETVTLASLQGSVVAVFFGYTNCPDVCPLTLAQLGQIQEDDSRTPPFRVVFVSVDPARDTPDRLREFARALPGEILALTAGEADVREQARDFGVLVQVPSAAADRDPKNYLVDHTARTFLVGPGGQVRASVPPMTSREGTERILDALYRALDAP